MSSDYLLTFEEFVSLHKNQLESSLVPQIYWETLYNKLIVEQFDAGNYFKIELVQYTADSESDEEHVNNGEVIDNEVDQSQHSYRVVVIDENGINTNDSKDIYLIDHMWTYNVNQAFGDLINTNGLIERLAGLMEIDLDDDSDDVTNRQLIARTILKEMWKWNQCYALESRDVENSLPVWYIMDEFGARIQHSSDPSFRCVPFYFVPRGIAYSLLFPIKSVSFGEEVTRNYIEGSINSNDEDNDQLLSQALAIPWIASDLSDVDCNQVEPEIAFMKSGRIEESICLNQTLCPQLPKDRKIKVYSEYSFINNYLTHDSFEITDSKSEADIIWLSTHFKQYNELSIEKPNVLINQFPFEHIITVKDLFAIVCRRKNQFESVDPDTLETSPEWLATTYNLQTEIVKFVSYFQRREKLGLDNYWIAKPWNLARGLDTQITNDLNCIIRLRNSVPKVVCKYISQPVLFRREDLNGSLVKFDIRYIVLLRSVSPLKLYVYRKFWLRFANKPFSLDDFDDYQKHFTVMNYTGGDTQLKQMTCEDFINFFNDQYKPDYRWADVEQNIFVTLRNTFECAIAKPPPRGIGHNLQSRAMYGVDIMLRWDQLEETKVIQPVLLEMNWAPDCERACLYYPNFFNDVFSALFLDNDSNPNSNVVLI